ncbi:MAG: ABC transporter ATP-binding protein [Armatimonadetes bacterium]|nr:ABC transporter ATP-binding protein [Armatimonadota bacterium]
MSAVLRADSLTRVFRDAWGRPRVTAVSDVSFEVGRGEVVGLLGPNGAGKSTTVKLLLGLLRPTAGAARILGQPPDSRAARAAVGYLPEETRLYPHLTATETLAFFAQVAGVKADLPALLARVGLTGAAHRRVGEYSKGMNRRLGLAQALLGSPELLVLDEPTSGLDPLGRRDVKQLIGELAAGGTTILLSSHLLAEVEDVCDRVLILCGGRLAAQGSLWELLSDPDELTLRLPRLDAETLARVLAAVRAETGAAVTVQPASLGLEAYFLDLVARLGAGGGQP